MRLAVADVHAARRARAAKIMTLEQALACLDAGIVQYFDGMDCYASCGRSQ